MRVPLLVAVTCLVAAVASAQNTVPAVPNLMELAILSAGQDPNTGGTPLGANSVQISPTVCSQAQLPALPANAPKAVNPARVTVHSPYEPTTKTCEIPIPGALPVGVDYGAWVRSSGTTCTAGATGCKSPWALANPKFDITATVLPPVGLTGASVRP